ncbi:MAG: hypothetical protein KKE89_06340 [Actinobacteria bacterium]|nr:hypothetical protein [Actinomycetota bacterium]
MSDLRCTACGEPGYWQMHHPTGTDHQRVHLDPEFTLRLCQTHHTLIHDDWRTLGIEEINRPLDPTETVALRLRRLGVTAARISSGDDLAAGLAATLPLWADQLLN